jgi:hypothetical protein
MQKQMQREKTKKGWIVYPAGNRAHKGEMEVRAAG